MKKLFTFLLISSAALAQNTVTVTASAIHNGSSGLLTAGSILFQAVNSSGQNISYQIGGTGPSLTSATVCPIVGGAIVAPPCILPNVSVSNPKNFCFQVTVKDASNLLVLGGPGSQYSCLQPTVASSWCTAASCNFDNFSPTIPNSVYVLQMPPPTATTLGGIYSGSCSSGLVVAGYDVTGREICVAGGGGGGGSSWGSITGTLSNQTDLYTYLLTLAPLNSPSFLGIPSAPTPLLSDNSTTIPNTSWVQSQGYAPLASPGLTGVPTAPTPATNDNSTKIANTAWVNAQGYGTGTGNVTGPGGSTNNDIALFSGTNGRTLADAGFGFPLAPSHVGTFAAGANGFVASAFSDTTSASNIVSGTLPPAQLPSPTTTTLGGVKAFTAVSHQWINSISTAGGPTSSRPACADLSNAAASCATDATNATNIISGTLAAARMGTGYPLNFIAAPTANWGTNTVPITLGTNTVALRAGDFGASPLTGSNGAVYITDNASSTTDITPNLTVDSGASPVSRHSSFSALLQGVQQFQICWQPGPQGKTMVGNALSCAAETTTPFAKFTIATSSAPTSDTHTILRLYTPHIAYVSSMLEMNNATAAGSTWNFFKFCSGATAGNGGCGGGAVVMSTLDGTGLFKTVRAQLTAGLFSTLSTCVSGLEGQIASVTDSTTNTWGATVTGTGTPGTHVLAYCDGTNWTVMGK